MRFVVLCFGLIASAALAKEPVVSGKFRVQDEVLIFDTVDVPDGASDEMENADVDELLYLLRRNPGITTLRLNSSGGSLWAGDEMSRLVIDFELDTEVQSVCASACSMVFLGGAKRSMQRGGKIGFHRSHWSPQDIANYYQEERVAEDWRTPFEFTAWVYEDTQEEIYQDLAFMLSRGVSAEFAIRSKQYFTEMWYPTRKELREGGFLRD